MFIQQISKNSMPASFGQGICDHFFNRLPFEDKLDLMDGLVTALAEEGCRGHFYEVLEDELWEARFGDNEWSLEEVEMVKLQARTDVNRQALTAFFEIDDGAIFIEVEGIPSWGSFYYEHKKEGVISPFVIRTISSLLEDVSNAREGDEADAYSENYDALENALKKAIQLKLPIVFYP